MFKSSTIATKTHRTGSSKNAIPRPEIRCAHKDAAGRQCRSLALGRSGTRDNDLNSRLCMDHATDERQFLDIEEIADEVLRGTPSMLNTTISVNRVIGKLFKLTLRNRIPTRKAALLAYYGSLLLNSVNGVKSELIAAEGPPLWEGLLDQSIEAVRKLNPQSGEEADKEESDEEDSDSESDASLPAETAAKSA
jgi:hypothetical protein